jgi:hypothetical protein
MPQFTTKDRYNYMKSKIASILAEKEIIEG